MGYYILVNKFKELRNPVVYNGLDKYSILSMLKDSHCKGNYCIGILEEWNVSLNPTDYVVKEEIPFSSVLDILEGIIVNDWYALFEEAIYNNNIELAKLLKKHFSCKDVAIYHVMFSYITYHYKNQYVVKYLFSLMDISSIRNLYQELENLTEFAILEGFTDLAYCLVINSSFSYLKLNYFKELAEKTGNTTLAKKIDIFIYNSPFMRIKCK